jgi:hypothetical protein
VLDANESDQEASSCMEELVCLAGVKACLLMEAQADLFFSS